MVFDLLNSMVGLVRGQGDCCKQFSCQDCRGTSSSDGSVDLNFRHSQNEMSPAPILLFKVKRLSESPPQKRRLTVYCGPQVIFFFYKNEDISESVCSFDLGPIFVPPLVG